MCYIVTMMDVVTYALTVDAHPQDGGFLASFPSLPGCHAWGDTFEAAVHNAEEALSVYLDTLLSNGDPLPEANKTDKSVSLGVMVRARLAA